MPPKLSVPLRPLLAAAVAVAVAVTGGATPGNAQEAPDVASSLPALDAGLARAWLAPLTDALGPALTAGFFTTGGRGEGIELGLRLNAGIVPSGRDTFRPALPSSVVFGGETYADPYVVASGHPTSPTVAGEGDGARVIPRPGSAFEAALDAADVPPAARTHRLPPGLDLNRAPVPMIEASLALRGLGLQLAGRFSPTLALFDGWGDVSTFGGGALLTVSRFLPPGAQVVAVGLSATTQKLEAGDWLEASASSFGILVSRDVGPVRAYVHGTVASADLDVRWTVANPGGLPLLPPDGTALHVRESLDGDARAAFGAVLGLSFLRLSAEYQPGSPDVASVRVTLLGP